MHLELLLTMTLLQLAGVLVEHLLRGCVAVVVGREDAPVPPPRAVLSLVHRVRQLLLHEEGLLGADPRSSTITTTLNQLLVLQGL